MGDFQEANVSLIRMMKGKMGEIYNIRRSGFVNPIYNIARVGSKCSTKNKGSRSMHARKYD